MQDENRQIQPFGAPRLADAVDILPVAVDHFSDVRFLHVAGYRAALGEDAVDDVEAFRRLVYSPAYIDGLAASDLLAARYGGMLVGTVSWRPSEEGAKTARVCALYVAPAFLHQGIGSRLLRVAEDRAARAGFQAVTARAKGGSIAFFERHGYQLVGLDAPAVAVPGGRGPTTMLRKAILSVDGRTSGTA